MNFDCQRIHPSHRPKKCMNGLTCTNPSCGKVHPKKHAAAQAAGHAHGHSKAIVPRHQAGAAAAAAAAGPATVLKFKDGAYKEKMVVQQVAGNSRRAAINFSVDTSGSMEGHRMTEAIAGLGHIVHNVMRDTDLYGLQTFNTSVINLHHCM